MRKHRDFFWNPTSPPIPKETDCELELMPQDLKIEINRLSRQEAMDLARYLAGVVGRAHGRQMGWDSAAHGVPILRGYSTIQRPVR
jgi:hypothetical protein